MKNKNKYPARILFISERKKDNDIVDRIFNIQYFFFF